nr:NSP5 protein [Bat rotavirus]
MQLQVVTSCPRMSAEPRFELRSKRKPARKQKLDIFGERDADSVLEVDCETESVASETTSSSHSYEDYSKAYKELTLETPVSQSIEHAEAVSTIVDDQGDDSWYGKTITEESVSSLQQDQKRRTAKSEGQTKHGVENDSLHIQIAQLSLRIQKMESETKLKTLDSAYNTIITQADNLTAPQKKSLINAILATMR